MSKITCEQCGHRIGVEAILPSEAWEAIDTDGAYALCVPCIDGRLAARGMRVRAHLFYRGRGLDLTALPDDVMAAIQTWRPSQMQVEQDGSVGLPALKGMT